MPTPPSVSADSGSTTDITPDQFSFGDLTHAGICKVYVSNIIYVSGINPPAPISLIQNATNAQYRTNGGCWRSSPGYVDNGDRVQLKMTASCLDGTTHSATLTIGGVSDTWSVTTRP